MNPEVIQTHDGSAITLRSCQGLDELRACVDLQIATWGYNDGDVIPSRLFVVAQRIGGQAIGAFDPSNQMVGFAMSIPGAVSALPHARRAPSGPEQRHRAPAQALSTAGGPEPRYFPNGMDLRPA